MLFYRIHKFLHTLLLQNYKRRRKRKRKTLEERKKKKKLTVSGEDREEERRKERAPAPVSTPRQEAAFCNGGMWLFLAFQPVGFQGLAAWQIMNEHPCTTTVANSISLSVPLSISLSLATLSLLLLQPWLLPSPLCLPRFPTATLDSPPRPTMSTGGQTRMRPNQRACVRLLSIRSATTSSPSWLLTPDVDDDDDESVSPRSTQPIGKKYAAGNGTRVTHKRRWPATIPRPKEKLHALTGTPRVVKLRHSGRGFPSRIFYFSHLRVSLREQWQRLLNTLDLPKMIEITNS